ncbi:response regulator [Panacibacter ginsenosidivorans]|uniref:response regulator n=1 Tax=Panacibacter ginsenosidivorans TaxID=1813871 RepID=UPI001315987C|nr:response regulator [Panacibacter ginsenosidivorans]
METSVRKKISKALIVDDEIDICYLLEGILKKKSVWSTYVNTLSDAQIMLRKETPSIIFLDNHLPDGLGVEFIDHIKKYYPSTKVVIITAVDSSSDRKMAYEHGADYFISKPFNMEIIYNVVEKLK